MLPLHDRFDFASQWTVAGHGIPAGACVDVRARMILVRKRFVPITIKVCVDESRREGGK